MQFTKSSELQSQQHQRSDSLSTKNTSPRATNRYVTDMSRCFTTCQIPLYAMHLRSTLEYMVHEIVSFWNRFLPHPRLPVLISKVHWPAQHWCSFPLGAPLTYIELKKKEKLATMFVFLLRNYLNLSLYSHYSEVQLILFFTGTTGHWPMGTKVAEEVVWLFTRDPKPTGSNLMLSTMSQLLWCQR